MPDSAGCGIKNSSCSWEFSCVSVRKLGFCLVAVFLTASSAVYWSGFLVGRPSSFAEPDWALRQLKVRHARRSQYPPSHPGIAITLHTGLAGPLEPGPLDDGAFLSQVATMKSVSVWAYGPDKQTLQQVCLDSKAADFRSNVKCLVDVAVPFLTTTKQAGDHVRFVSSGRWKVGSARPSSNNAWLNEHQELSLQFCAAMCALRPSGACRDVCLGHRGSATSSKGHLCS